MSDLPEISSKILPRLVKIFTAVAVLTIGLFGSLVWYTWDTFRYLETTQKNYFRLTELSGSIEHLDEVLTMSAHMAAATGEQTWEARYRGFETKLDAAINEAMVLGQGFSLKDAVDKTDTANLKLVDMENQVFDLVRKGQTEKAAAILSSAEYDAQKKNYTNGIAQITETIRGNIEKNITDYRHRGYLAISSILIVTPCLVFGWILVALLIRQYNTNRKQAEEALRESEERYQSLFEQAGDGIFILDTNGKILSVNQSLASMHGFTVEEMLRMGLDGLDAEGTAPVPDRIRRIMRGETLSFEAEHYHKDGHTFPLAVTANLVSSGNDRLIIAIHRGLTERKRAEEQLQHTLDSLRKAVIATVQVLVSAVETRDPYTAGHQIRSADLARAIATEMGLPPEKIEGIRMAGSIHDIGKLSIPAEILSKPTKLSELEFSLIKEHARRGFEMLKDVESPWPLAEMVYQHHERMDGSGYPRQLKGGEICMEARILAVSDVVESMASHRPYRPGLGIDVALEEIEQNRGIFYDNTVADACLRLFREKGFKLEGN